MRPSRPMLSLFSAALLLALPAFAQQSANKPDRLDWFQDQGLGLFIHWSVDSQLGLIISHSLAGASDEYVNRFYRDLPQTFDPTHFDPDAIARLARVAGFRYMVFTTKHHNGFAMWNTKTTDFSITHTPYRRDITAELFEAFRKQGIPPGVYFSPDDFRWLHENGKQIQRLVPEVQPSHNPGLLALDKAQVTELVTRYGPIGTAFFDGESTGLRDIVWKNQPNAVITRGAMETPEQTIPGAPLPGPWEANMTLGSAWGYQPSDEHYKTPQELIRILVETRARGGNLLLNVGPKPDGSLPQEEEDALRTLGSWLFINGDAIYSTRPWNVTNEGDIWFTRSKDHHALYAILDDPDSTPIWRRGQWRDVVLKSVRATATTKISVLGQNDQLVEYRPNLKPQSTFQQLPDGLHIHVMRAQRMRDSDRWQYPTVVRLTDVEQAFTPPTVHTLPATPNPDGSVTLHGDWSEAAQPDAAPSDGVQVGFETRIITGEDTNSRLHGWEHMPLQPAPTPSHFQSTFRPDPRERYEYRTVLRHPLTTVYGDAVPIPTR